MRHAIATKEITHLPLAESTHQSMKQLIEKILDKNQETRPDASELLKREKVKQMAKLIAIRVINNDINMGLALFNQLNIEISVNTFDFLEKESKCTITRDGIIFFNALF
jgi:hypothetical protein